MNSRWSSDEAEYATGYLYNNLTHWQLSNGQKINEAGHTLVWVFDDSTHKHEECNICDYKTDSIYVPPITVTVPMTLPDDSVLFYDRGEEYGSYHIGDDGYPVRDDGAVDDGTAESKNWRYLITLPYDLNYYDSDYSGSWDERGRCSPNYSELAIGSGLSNSISIIKENASDDWSFYGKQLWDCIKDYRDSTGIEWFVPSIDELSILYGNKNGLNFDESDDWYSSKYWSSSVYSDAYAWYIDFSTGEKDYTGKEFSYSARLIRRI